MDFELAIMQGKVKELLFVVLGRISPLVFDTKEAGVSAY